ncbi:hypothetical protein DL95DRAFT_480624 [Leptodontidium sp. 2 PMI_412]|nr:hypothetical protein DL95DRAFT_480624 [Leptodontidium sp. 2 PMI_412]
MSRHESNNYASSLDADSIFPIKCTDEVDVGDSDAQENNGPLSYRMSHLRRGDSEAGVALLSPDSMYIFLSSLQKTSSPPNNNRLAVLTYAQKQMFNAFITGLCIALGLNIATALNAMAFNLRWWFLARQLRSLDEVDTILKSDFSSLSSYFLTPRPWAAGVTIAWLVTNIASQVGVATIGLTYSMDATLDAAVLSPNGTIMVANLSDYIATNMRGAQLPDASQYTANVLGQASLFVLEAVDTLTPKVGNTYGDGRGAFWLADDHCFYMFMNWPPDSTAGISHISVYSDRLINSTWSCSAQSVTPQSGNGTSNEITVNDAKDGSTFVVHIPSVRPTETTYFTSSKSECGPRCQNIKVFEASYQQPWYYDCNITVGTVGNVTLPEHVFSDFMASVAAAAIAYGGSFENNTYGGVYSQRYPQQSLWGIPQEGEADSIGASIAAFAISTVAMVDQSNPRIPSYGLQPQAGWKLNIPDRWIVYLIFSLAGVIQFVLYLLTTFMANLVIVSDDSFIAIARLLTPIVNRVGDSGSIATGKEICEALTNEDGMRVIYSIQREGDKRVRLELGNIERERAFPNGKYA